METRTSYSFYEWLIGIRALKLQVVVEVKSYDIREMNYTCKIILCTFSKNSQLYTWIFLPLIFKSKS